jgi:hypothetical protein
VADLPEIRCADCPRLLTDPVSRARGRGSQHYREWLAAHPELAPRRRMPAVPKPRPAVEPMPDQLDLFELSEVSDV